VRCSSVPSAIHHRANRKQQARNNRQTARRQYNTHTQQELNTSHGIVCFSANEQSASFQPSAQSRRPRSELVPKNEHLLVMPDCVKGDQITSVFRMTTQIQQHSASERYRFPNGVVITRRSQRQPNEPGSRFLDTSFRTCQKEPAQYHSVML